MSTTDPNWSDDSFDTMDDGFLPRQAKVAEPVSSYQPPVPPPPLPRSAHSSSPKRAIALLLLFFFTAVGLIITWVVREPKSDLPRGGSQSRVKPVDVAKQQTDTLANPVPIQPQTQTQTQTQTQNQTPAQKPIAPQQSAARVEDVERESASELETASMAKAEKKNETVSTPVKPPTPQPTTRSSTSSAQEWCVQVFASTNPDDADEWNGRLRKKNVEDSRIEMIERQGQLWYRVRYGRFGSKQEAEQVAQTMGFRNAWVNRAR